MGVYIWTGTPGRQPGANTIAYYPLTSSTTVNDLSGNNYNFSGNATFGVDEGVDCCQIRGYSNLLTTNNSFLYNKNNFTISLWLCRKSGGNALQVIFKTGGTSGNGTMLLYYLYDGHLYSSKNNDDWDGVYNFTYSQWTNLCGVYDGSTYKTYINGTLVVTWTTTMNIAQSGNTSLGGGTNFNSNDCFWGDCSEFIFEDKSRTAQEISDYYNSTKSTYGL